MIITTSDCRTLLPSHFIPMPSHEMPCHFIPQWVWKHIPIRSYDSQPPLPLSALGTTNQISISIHLATLEFQINRTIYYVAFCDWLVSLSIIFSKFTMLQYILVLHSFLCQVIFLCRDLPCFVYSFITRYVSWSLWLLLLWILVYNFFLCRNTFFIYLGYVLLSELGPTSHCLQNQYTDSLTSELPWKPYKKKSLL